MKILKILLILLVFASCRSTRLTTESKVDTSKKTEVNQSKDTEVVNKTESSEITKVNNDKTKVKKTITVETTYYPPAESQNDSTKEDKGAVESVVVTTIEESEIDKYISETGNEIKSDSSAKVKEDSSTKIDDKSTIEKKNTEKKTKPIPWGWIFGILVLVAIGIWYFRNSPIISKIRSSFSKMMGKPTT